LIYPLRSSLMSMPQKSLGLLLTKWLSDGVVYIKDCDFQYIIYQKVTKSNLWGYIYSHRSWYSKKKFFFEEDPYLWQHAWKNRVSEKRPTNLWVHAADGINRKCSSIYIYIIIDRGCSTATFDDTGGYISLICASSHFYWIQNASVGDTLTWQWKLPAFSRI
jgi:hypothetical protein